MTSKRKNGFSFLEILIVIVILGILIRIGTIYWQKQVREREYQAQFDILVQQVREAQTLARAYGQEPEGYDGSGGFDNDASGDYTGVIIVKGLNTTQKTARFKNVRIRFMNFSIKSMAQENLDKDFKGVALGFGLETEGVLGLNKMLPFGPSGVPLCPIGEYAPADDFYEIEMSRIDSAGNPTHQNRIYIDKVTGVIRTAKIK